MDQCELNTKMHACVVNMVHSVRDAMPATDATTTESEWNAKQASLANFRLAFHDAVRVCVGELEEQKTTPQQAARQRPPAELEELRSSFQIACLMKLREWVDEQLCSYTHSAFCHKVIAFRDVRDMIDAMVKKLTEN